LAWLLLRAFSLPLLALLTSKQSTRVIISKNLFTVAFFFLFLLLFLLIFVSRAHWTQCGKETNISLPERKLLSSHHSTITQNMKPGGSKLFDCGGPINAISSSPDWKFVVVGGRDVMKILSLEKSDSFSEAKNLRRGHKGSVLMMSANDVEVTKKNWKKRNEVGSVLIDLCCL
jgi:hypothetical protein